jgi:hypothetical protein
MSVVECEAPAFLDGLSRAVQYLRGAIPVLEAACSLQAGSLVLPDWDLAGRDSLRLIKQFCVGLLENPEGHVWWPVVGRLSASNRMSLAGSLFLARKLLPVKPSPPSAHRARVCTSVPPVLPPGYLGRVRLEVSRLLGEGWDLDCGYQRHVESFTPPMSATLSTPRSKGGCRQEWSGRGDDFRDACLGRRRFSVPRSFDVRFMNVDGAGKSRSLTVASSAQALLGPLHRCLYEAVSRRQWLLRGEATQAKFSSFDREESEVFVSGDYESATDNLPLEVAEAILSEAERLSRCIPREIWMYARRSLRASVAYPDLSVPLQQVRGQLMGNLLSFPLLCIQNYVAFRWCVSRTECPDSRVRINGDDIVFRATRRVASRWMSTVSSLGLVVSPGKTLVLPGAFSLNSTFFRVGWMTGPRLVPVLRGRVLAEPCEVPHSLAPGLRTFCRGFRGEARVRAQAFYLRWRGREFRALGRSVVRDLGARVSPASFVRAGLGRAEAFYRSLPPNPLPVDRVRLGGTIPEGWVRTPLSRCRVERRAQECLDRSFWELVRDRAWSGGAVSRQLSQATWRDATGTGHLQDWLYWHERSSRAYRFRRLFRSLTCRLPHAGSLWTETSSPARSRVRQVWVPDALCFRSSYSVRLVKSEVVVMGSGPGA